MTTPKNPKRTPTKDFMLNFCSLKTTLAIKTIMGEVAVRKDVRLLVINLFFGNGGHAIGNDNHKGGKNHLCFTILPTNPF